MEEAKAERKANLDDLIAACNSLGQVDINDGVYMKDRDCKACLKEIIRSLNNDTKQHDIRCKLGSLNIVRSDLIPIINQYCDFNDGDTDLLNLVLRLCSNLTSPIILLFENQEIPRNIESTQLYNKLMEGLFTYKEAFANEVGIWMTLNMHLRHTEDEVTFERLLILIRNILHIPVDARSDLRGEPDFGAHDKCLNWMSKSGILQTLIDIANETKRGTEFCFHIIEIVYLMLRDKNPVTIASSKKDCISSKRKLDDDDPDKIRLAELRARERAKKVQRTAPRFRGSTYVVQNCSSISDAPVIMRQLPLKDEPISFDNHKTDVKKNKNRKPFDSSETSAFRSDMNTRFTKVSYPMKLFCKQFSEKVYANYMQQIKYNLIQKKSVENDETYYLWAIQFFTSFNRHMSMNIYISETLSSSTLHFIQIIINDYQEKLKMEKSRNKIQSITIRIHMAIRAYKEILSLIQSVNHESEFITLAEQIKKKLFTELEYNNLLLSLFQQYDESKFIGAYLKDLICTNEIFLKLGSQFETMTNYNSPDVVRAYASVLKGFKTNDSAINLSILDFFERLAFNQHMETMLMQASIFVTLLNIINDPDQLGHERFVKLAEYLMSKFVKLVSIDGKRWMFQELLFWKSHGDVLEIEHDPRAEQIITAETVDDKEESVAEDKHAEEEAGDDFVVPDDEGSAEADLGGLSPLSQISGVDDYVEEPEQRASLLLSSSDDDEDANDSELASVQRPRIEEDSPDIISEN